MSAKATNPGATQEASGYLNVGPNRFSAQAGGPAKDGAENAVATKAARQAGRQAELKGFEAGRESQPSWKSAAGYEQARKEPSATLRPGQEGAAVRELQKLLGIPEAQRDGKFGEATQRAVAQFQEKHGLKPPAGMEGHAGPTTLRALEKVVHAGPELGQGSGGAEVEGLQRQLNRLGHQLAEDGRFGPATEAAVRQFQAKLGLKLDGIVGPETRAALDRALHLAVEQPTQRPRGTAAGAAPAAKSETWAGTTPPKDQPGKAQSAKIAAGKSQATKPESASAPPAKTAPAKPKVGKLSVPGASLRDTVKGGTVLQQGASGDAVREMQKRLTKLGHPVKATGQFGPTTELALKSFQAANGVGDTGKFGLTTLQAMQKAEKGGISGAAKQQMQRLLDQAIQHSGGHAANGQCYEHVAKIIDKAGYGRIQPGGFDAAIPGAYWAEAKDFARYLNQGNNADRLGMKRLPLDNPYDAPPGAIIVVRAGSPGTSHATAGDIAIAAGNGRFLNDGEMGYEGRNRWPKGNDYVLGIYVPK